MIIHYQYRNDNVSYNCNIISHNAKLIHREDGNYFMAIATVYTLWLLP